jgi:hypothetical protein
MSASTGTGRLFASRPSREWYCAFHFFLLIDAVARMYAARFSFCLGLEAKYFS